MGHLNHLSPTAIQIGFPHSATSAALSIESGPHRRPADFPVDHLNVRHELKQFVDAGNLPCPTMLMGKGVLDEFERNSVGTYEMPVGQTRCLAPTPHRITGTTRRLIALSVTRLWGFLSQARPRRRKVELNVHITLGG
jgi:hypothetical protein